MKKLFLLIFFISFNVLSMQNEEYAIELESFLSFITEEIGHNLENDKIEREIHYETEWTLKKGTKRKCQWWLYCESNQANYLKVNFYLIEEGEKLALDIYIDEQNQLLGYSNKFKHYFYLYSSAIWRGAGFPKKLDVGDFFLELSLVLADSPSRSPAELRLKDQNSPDALSFISTIKISRRVAGFHEILIKLFYVDHFAERFLIKEGRTAPFKLNNPRWPHVLKDSLSGFSAAEIYLMSLIDGGEIEPSEYEIYAIKYGVNFNRITDLVKVLKTFDIMELR